MLSSNFWCAAEIHLDPMNLQEVAIKLTLVMESCCSSECFAAEQAPCPHDCQCHVHKQQQGAGIKEDCSKAVKTSTNIRQKERRIPWSIYLHSSLLFRRKYRRSGNGINMLILLDDLETNKEGISFLFLPFVVYKTL